MTYPTQASKGLLLSTLCSMVLILLATSAFAQQCDNANAGTVHEIVTEVAERCCSKSSASRQRRCIARNKNKKLKRAGRSGLPSEFMQVLNEELTAMRASSCTDITVDVVCNNTYAATPNEVATNIEERCCDLTRNSKRRNCLTKSRRRLRAARELIGTELYSSVRTEISTLLNAESCGEGGQRTSCDSFRSTAGGFVHKPVSESTHSVVNLFPVGERPSNCRYENSSGDVFTTAYYAGIHNGNRVHIRPNNATSCRNFPSPLILNCQHGSQRICRQMNNSCTRYD